MSTLFYGSDLCTMKVKQAHDLNVFLILCICLGLKRQDNNTHTHKRTMYRAMVSSVYSHLKQNHLMCALRTEEPKRYFSMASWHNESTSCSQYSLFCCQFCNDLKLILQHMLTEIFLWHQFRIWVFHIIMSYKSERVNQFCCLKVIDCLLFTCFLYCFLFQFL